MHRIHRLGVIGLVLLAASARADSKGTVLLLAGHFESKPAVSLVVPAEIMVFRLSINSLAEKVDDQLRDLQTARGSLAEFAGKQGWRLKTDQIMVVSESYRKFSSFSSSSGELDARAQPLLVVPLTDQADVVTLVRRVRQLAEHESNPKKLQVRVEGYWVGVGEPERFRSELLKLIRHHIDTTADALGSNLDLEISGLDEPIMAQQVEERVIELSLPMKVTYTRKAR